MLLTFDKIKSITKGAIDFKEGNGYLYPRRCTEKQTAAWYKLGEVHGNRSKMSAGVRLDFYTDSTTLYFEYEKGNSYTLLIDGIFVGRIGKEENGIFETYLPSGKKRVTVVFFYDRYGGIKALGLDDGAICEPIPPKAKRFLFLGDSITQGYNTEYEFINYPYLVSEHFDADYLNQAIGGGDFFVDTLDESLDYNPDAVFIAFGTNDWSHFPTLGKLRERCSDYLDGIVKLYGDKRIFGLTPLWRADENAGRPMGSFKQCCDLIKEEYISRGITVIDGYTLTPHEKSFYFDEYLHPNALGFEMYAQNLIKQVSKYMQ